MNRAPLVLVVDDQAQILRVVTTLLERAGFATIVAISGNDALKQFTNEVDVVLTDCTLPDLNGAQLAARLLERKPTLCTLFMSGSLSTSCGLGIPMEVGVNFLEKPFQAEHLVVLVENGLRRVKDRKA